ncbi:proteinase-activated receptor 3 isoform X2 [Rhineura floridana]|uniref:proteinase-activated receptor 3 isoform X2 n=1 Tax=Rhineura floridana TaxID=261503 RepID=UPI002AC84A8E|nr:proteinase-activated receptor 3 isoform X2 [Rhineura floridana]
MTILLFLTSGLFFLSSCLSQKERKCDNSSLDCEGNKLHPIKTFHGTPQDTYEKIPHSAIEGLTKTSHNQENNCSMERSNVSVLKSQISPDRYILHKLSHFGFPFLCYAAIQNYVSPQWQ